jgi:hypothetical protein
MYAQTNRYKTKVWADILPIHSSTKYAPILLYSTDNSEIIQKVKSRLEQRNETWLKKNNRMFPKIKRLIM